MTLAAPMRVLLTGNRGYIGTVMGPMLAAAGHDVVGLDTDFYAACTFLGPVPEIPTIRRDLRDATPEDLAGFDAVVHLAALSNDPLGDLTPEITYAINHRGSVPSRRSRRRRGSPASSSRPPAAITGRRATPWSTRRRPSTP